ncbi:hypothetical protein TIFTF001_021998 [Ficus carica]|uniref:Monocopper oxidase-like protein SKU5 n=1 Tax=Ficus carica TaxID=3494 RepID=A0AA88DJW9_FICCA|nr:hypothetical protein TIFTF001_021998 [Ficus carica]
MEGPILEDVKQLLARTGIHHIGRSANYVNGIQQRLNSWQDGVSGTNYPIEPGKNWTYVFQVKDQVGTFFYFPSINFQKAGGGFGPNNHEVISVPFPKPEAEFDLLIGDWYKTSYKDVRVKMKKSHEIVVHETLPDIILMNGKGSYINLLTKSYESFTVTKGPYRIRITNVGIAWSFNFRIQNHTMVLVETEGSYTNQVTLDSLDVHVGQSYSVLITADQDSGDYYMVAAPKLQNAADSSRYGLGVLHYEDSYFPPSEALPSGPDSFDLEFSINQARSIRWNLTTGAARPNPQGTFNVRNVTLSQTFILSASIAEIGEAPRFTVNNVSYLTPETPLELAEHSGSRTYDIDKYPTSSKYPNAEQGVFVASGTHKGWIELVFKNEFDVIDSWHLDGFGFYVVGKMDRSLCIFRQSGDVEFEITTLEELVLGRIALCESYDPDPNPAKEKPIPSNLLQLVGKNGSSSGKIASLAPSPTLAPSTLSNAPSTQSSWFHVIMIYIAVILNLRHYWMRFCNLGVDQK